MHNDCCQRHINWDSVIQFLCIVWKVTTEFFTLFIRTTGFRRTSGRILLIWKRYSFGYRTSLDRNWEGQAGVSLVFESDVPSITGNHWTKMRRTSGRKPHIWKRPSFDYRRSLDRNLLPVLFYKFLSQVYQHYLQTSRPKAVIQTLSKANRNATLYKYNIYNSAQMLHIPPSLHTPKQSSSLSHNLSTSQTRKKLKQSRYSPRVAQRVPGS